MNFVARSVERSLALYLSMGVPKRPRDTKDEWMRLSEAATGTRFSQEYLSLLARKGRLEAIKQGRNWMTTARAIRDYEQSLQRSS